MKKNISFLSDFFQFWEMKFSLYLNRRVFVMEPETPIPSADHIF